MGAMPEDHTSDDSGSANPGRAVRFVDPDLSINPSHTGQDPAAERPADRYYKDVQSIHGDTVRDSLAWAVLLSLKQWTSPT